MCPSNQLSYQVLIARWKIHVLDWTKNRLPIKRSKLAHEVAKKVERYLDCIAVCSRFDVINFTAAHYCVVVETYFGWIRGGSVEGW